MEKLYILDASGFLYRSYFAIRNITNSKGESTNALYGFIRSVQKLFKDFHPNHIVCIFDGPHNAKSREQIYPDYKAHRASMPPDLLYQIGWAKTYCELMGIPFLNVPEVEADDTMGSVAKWAERQGADVFLCTSDKDLCQIVDEHIFILNTHKENLLIGPAQVEEIHGVPPKLIVDLFAIIGDTSDNVPGIQGFGPKTASALLREFGSLDYLLEHPEAIAAQKKQEIFIREKDKAIISRQLVTIDTEIEFPKEESFFHWDGPPSFEKLKEFYSSMNFNSLLKELEQTLPKTAVEEVEAQYILVDDESSLKEMVKSLSAHAEICFETETTDPHPLRGELVGIGFGVAPRQAWYVPANGRLGLEKVLEALKPLFENKALSFYGHDVKYDLQVLKSYGISISRIGFDTMVASYLLKSNLRQHSLEQLSLEFFGKLRTDIKDLTGKGKKEVSLTEVPILQLSQFCCESVDYIFRLKQIFHKQLEERNLSPLFFNLELPLLPILAKMERQGIYLDVPFLSGLSESITAQIRTLEQEIYAMAGMEFNLNSPKQLSEVLFQRLGIHPPKKTATGLSTNADVLESLKDRYPIAEKIIEYRSLEKLRSTYVDILPQQVIPKTQRIHCTFNQSVAATGRLSCQDPNLQNIPVRTEIGRQIRQAFRPQKEGWSYLAADYSQVELRLLAHLSEDPSLIEAFASKQDIHAHTASAIFNVPLNEVTSEMRYRAKAVNFGIIYGQQAFGLSQELKIERKEAELFINMYFKRYNRVRDFLESCKEEARKTGKAVTYTGRERAIPEIHSKNIQIRNAAERLAVNTPIQGTAADLIKMAMLNIDKFLQKEKKLGYLILQIHDELIFEVPDFEILTIEPMVRKAMEEVIKLKVPLVVDVTIGKNWKEC